jgi:hypothetical protein
MLGTGLLATRPLASSPRLPRPFRPASVAGEFGWAAWSFSRQAKLNAWGWHGLGGGDLYAMTTLGNVVYVRKSEDGYMHALNPDVFYADGEVSTESQSVEATTQWLDFGQPGKTKTITGIDIDALGVQAVEVYVFIPNPEDRRDRTPTLAATIPLGDAESGWTYNGGVIATEDVGAGTEFMLRFICESGQEATINRLTLYWEPVAA